MNRLSLLRRLFAGAQTLDRADWPMLRLVPSSWKRRGMRALFRSAQCVLGEGGVVTLEGLRWSIPPSMRSTFVLQHHEPGVRRVLDRILRPGMTVVDVGANIGYHTVFSAKRVLPGGRVVAVEADAENAVYLRENLRLNGVGDGTGRAVTVLEVAAGAARYRRPFHRRPDAGHHGFYEHPTEKALETVEVEVAPLDELVESPVDLVKIDVEAGEMDVLAGMEKIVAESPGLHLLVEWNPPLMKAAGLDPHALPERVTALGFDLSVVREPDGGLQPFALLDVDLDQEYDLLAQPAGGGCLQRR